MSGGSKVPNDRQMNGSIDIDVRRFEDLRERLVDRTRRNRLLHFRHASRGSLLRIVDESLNRVLDHLRDQRAFRFRPLPDLDDDPADERTREFRAALAKAGATDENYRRAIAELDPEDPSVDAKEARLERELRDRVRDALGLPPRPHRKNLDIASYARTHGIDPSYDITSPKDAPKHSDDYLKTLLFRDQLRSRTASIFRHSRAIEQETGVSTLHLAFGFLEWFESDDSTEAFHSPLLLLPANLERRVVRGTEEEYRLSALDDEPITNLSLELRLRESFRLSLPVFDGENGSIESYFDQINHLIAKFKRWRIRRFLTLAPFSFSRIAMYRDLDRANWGGNSGSVEHPLVRPVLRGIQDNYGEGVRQPSNFASEHDVDDPTVEAVAPILVHDADSSQHSAIIDAMQGANLVVEGPPGTGKSQTISNLIANFLRAGKSVLFVSEKMAALDVVKVRLDKVGLGHFCLTLHASGAKPAAVIDALHKRANLPQPRPILNSDAVARARRARAEINKHLDAMHAIVGPRAESVHALIGRVTDLGRLLPHLPELLRTFASNIPDDLELETYEVARERLEVLEAAANQTVPRNWNPAASEFRALKRIDLFQDEQAQLIDALKQATLLCIDCQTAAKDFGTALGEMLPSNLNSLRSMIDRVRLLSDPGEGVAEDLVKRITTPSLAIDAQWVADRLEMLSISEETLRNSGIKSAETLDHQRLEAIAAAARLAGLPDCRPSEVSAQARAASDLADRIALATRAAEKICDAFGFRDPDAEILRLACLSINRAAELDVAWSRFRKHGLERHVAALSNAATTQEALLDEKRQLAASISLENTSPASLRQLSAEFARAGWFAFLRPQFHRANRDFKRLWLNKDIPARRERASRLQEAATLLADIDQFRSDSVLRGIFGQEVDPWSLPVRHIAQSAEWQVRVFQSISGDRIEVAQLRTSLLTMDDSRAFELASLNGLATSLSEQLRRDAIANRDRLDALSIRAANRASQLAELAELVAELPAALDPPLRQLDGIAIAVREREIAKRDLLGARAQAILSDSNLDPKKLRNTAEFAKHVHATIPTAAPLVLRDWNGTIHHLRNSMEHLATQVSELLHTADQLSKLGLPHFATMLEAESLDTIAAQASRFAEAEDELPTYLRFGIARDSCRESLLANSVATAFEQRSRPFEHLPEALDWLVAWAFVRRRAETTSPTFLKTGDQLSNARRTFASADRDRMKSDALAVAAEVLRKPVPLGSNHGSKRTWTEDALLQNEFSKQKRHTPVRDLLARAGNAVLALTPCLMMSPLTVAQYLRPRSLTFDLVVMDEASQIKPEDAIGALLRGRQAIIVGDPKQLPPTNFFDRALDDGGDDAEDEGSAGQASLSSDDRVVAESVLDLAARAFRPARRLRWHYRSQHERLIAFSNREFYDDNLVVFPAAHPPSATLGIEYVRVNGTWHGRVNVVEARAVAHAVVQFMNLHPDLSHGVVAMNHPQRDLIEAEIDLLTSRDAPAAAYREHWEGRLEPPFIKNLENVQGDERDVIFISLGWGKSQEGVVHQRFFPINRSADGHRRLNVLFTRAKRKIVLFSSLDPESIVVDPEKSSRGVRVLRDYLLYARDGRLERGHITGHEAESPFETAVANALRARGHNVSMQIGVAGYRVDIAARHPTYPDRFVLGIECDGAAYHSAKSARDRDRLRQDALERLGWRLTRIWSTDWFQAPAKEADRLSAEITRAIAETANVNDATKLVDLPADEAPATPSSNASLSDTPPTGQSAATSADKAESSTEGARPEEGDLPSLLRRFRDEVILKDHPASDPARCILRDELIEAMIQSHLDDPDDFHSKVPESLRTRTDGRQRRYLDEICDLIANNQPDHPKGPRARHGEPR